MTRHDPISERILRIAEPVCASSGYEVVDVRFTMEPGGWILRVMIDRPPEPGERVDLAEIPAHRVDLDDCERISRELSAVLDVEDPIPQAYSLEVSSPGIDRPLRTPEHFRRYVGADVKVTMAVPVPVPGGTGGGAERKNFKGTLVGVEPPDGEDGDPVALVDTDAPGGTHTFRLRIADIEQARLVPDWDAVLKGGSGIGTAPSSTGRGKPRPRA